MHARFLLGIFLATTTANQLVRGSPLFSSIQPRWLPDLSGMNTPSPRSSDPAIARAQQISIKIRDAVTIRVSQQLTSTQFPTKYTHRIYTETVNFLNTVRPGQSSLPTQPDAASTSEGLGIILERSQNDAEKLKTAIADSAAQATAQYSYNILTKGKGGEFDPNWSDTDSGSSPDSGKTQPSRFVIDALIIGLGQPLKIHLNGLLKGLSKTWYFHLYDIFLPESCPTTGRAGDPLTCAELRKALSNRRDALGDRLQPAVQDVLYEHWPQVTDTTSKTAQDVVREQTK